MARKKAPRDYREPWTPTKSKLHGERPFKDGLPADWPEGVAQGVLDAWERADQNADWVVWGSRMAAPTVVTNLNGKSQVMDDQRIVLVIRRSLGLPEGAPNQEEIAKRIAECVNALAGVGDPSAFMVDVRALLHPDYARLEGAIAISHFLARFPHYELAGEPVRGGRARFRGFTSVPCKLNA